MAVEDSKIYLVCRLLLPISKSDTPTYATALVDMIESVLRLARVGELALFV